MSHALSRRSEVREVLRCNYIGAFFSAILSFGQNGIGSVEGNAAIASNKIDSVEVLTDTQGVDFGPYLPMTIQAVRDKWYSLIPQEARPPEMKQGDVKVEFSIGQKGAIGAPKVIKASGDDSLDCACTNAVLEAAPFHTLPLDFNGDRLLLRFHFYYNLQKTKPASQAQHP